MKRPNPEKIFSIGNPADFQRAAIEVFRFQYRNNPVYNRFCRLLNRTSKQVHSLEDIPFLPIEFFKSHEVVSSPEPPELIFSSSGTTGSHRSRHYVTDLRVYEESFMRSFRMFYGQPEDYAILALLPSYLERDGSSLIYMVDSLIKKSNNSNSGFYLDDLESLVEKVHELERAGEKTLLIGVSFALLDLAEQSLLQLENTVVMETGGMKGRRRELIRKELHELLRRGFGVKSIHSEYGMTELLSQAYSSGDGLFRCPPWMKILIRDPEDAVSFLPPGKSGGVNIIDLANINSCSFLATQDLGKDYGGGQVEILGRFDHSDIRGCNLLVF